MQEILFETDAWVLTEKLIKDTIENGGRISDLCIKADHRLSVVHEDDTTLKGYMDHRFIRPNFIQSLDQSKNAHSYSIINIYNDERNTKEIVYMTFDKKTVYRLEKIFESKPLLFVFKLIDIYEPETAITEDVIVSRTPIGYKRWD